MRHKLLATFVLTLSVAILAAACGGGDDEEPTPRPAATNTSVPATATDTPTLPAGNGTSAGQVVNIVLTEGPYTFEPDSFDFELGKTYTLIFEAPGEFHTFTINDLGVDISILPGQAVTQTITFEQAGDFQLICIPHLVLGMVGTVTVK